MTHPRVGSWIQTKSGIAFYPLDPTPQEINIEDIAWSLSMQCRYLGHANKFYSVAEHSVLVAESLPSDLALYGLLHDASEAYLMDIPRPIKPLLQGYEDIEQRLMKAIAEKFGLSWPLPLLVKAHDERILTNEKAELMLNVRPWATDNLEPLPNIKITGWPQKRAYMEFINLYHALV